MIHITAPSAKNQQPWHLTAVTDQALLAEINSGFIELTSDNPDLRPVVTAPGYSVFYHAPLVIFIACDRFNAYGPIDCGIAGENMALAAESLGLGTCFLGAPMLLLEHARGEPLARRLGIPPGHKSLLALAIGTADQPTQLKTRDESKITRLLG